MTETVAAPEVAGSPRRGRRVWWVVAGAAVIVLATTLVWMVVRGAPATRLSRAPDATVAAGTARVTMATSVTGLRLAPDLRLAVAEGDVDLQAQQARLLREVPGLARLPFVGTRFEPVELRYDAGDVYVRLPVGGQQRWVQLRDVHEQPDAPEGPRGGLGNPAALLAILAVLDEPPRVVASEQVGGVPTTRFGIVVDLDRATERFGEGPARVAQGIRLVHGQPRLPMDVWLDDRDRIRRIRYVLRTDVPVAGELVLTTDVDLFDFGAAVDTEPPPPEELVSLPDVGLPEIDPIRLLQDLLRRVPAT